MFGLIILSFFQLKLPDTIRGDEMDFITVTAETSGKSVMFVALDPGLKVFPSNLLSDPKSTVVTGKSGRYRILAYTSINDMPTKPVITTVVIGNAAPPSPPNPDPVPSDKLKDELTSLWNSNNEIARLEKKNALSSVYKRAAQACMNPEFKSAAEIATSLQSEAERDVPKPALQSIRDRAGLEFKKILPLDRQTMTQKEREDGSAIFLRVAAILDELQ